MPDDVEWQLASEFDGVIGGVVVDQDHLVDPVPRNVRDGFARVAAAFIAGITTITLPGGGAAGGRGSGGVAHEPTRPRGEPRRNGSARPSGDLERDATAATGASTTPWPASSGARRRIAAARLGPADRVVQV